MNKTTVFVSKNSSLSYEYGRYCSQICGPSKLLFLEDKEENFQKIPRFLVFVIPVFKLEKNSSESIAFESEKSQVDLKLYKLLNDKVFYKNDIDIIKKMFNLNLINSQTEIYFIFILEYINNSNKLKDFINLSYFIEDLNAIIKSIKGYYLVNSKSESEKESLIGFLRNLRIQTISPIKQMEQNNLAPIIYQFITSHDVCVIATGYKEFVRATSVEYIFKNNKFYIISESGEKYANLSCNKNIALTIFDSIQIGGRTKSIQVQGLAKIYDIFDDEIHFISNLRGLDKNIISSLNFELYVIEIEPISIELYDPSLKEAGYSTRQIFNPENFN